MGKVFTQKHQNRAAFTVVELIVIIVVIAILAGVSVVGYGAWRKDIAVKQVVSDLTQAAAAMESARNFGTGYPSAVPDTFTASNGVTITYGVGDAKKFCITGVNAAFPTEQYRFYSLGDKAPAKGDCVLYENVVVNPQPTSSALYTPNSTGVAAVSFYTDGTKWARLTRITTSATALYVGRSTGGVAVAQTGNVYTMRYTIRSSITTTGVTSQLGYGASGSTSVIGGTSNLALSLSANVPLKVSYTFTIPNGFDAQALFPKILWNGGAVGDYIEVTDFMMLRGAYPAGAAYADGSSGGGWGWEGEVNNSRSSGPAFYSGT